MFKHKRNNPKIKLIINAPSNDKKSLEKVENGYIEEYAEMYNDLLINIKSNPNKKTQKIKYEVNIENKKQLLERIAKLEQKITIKDNINKSRWCIDSIVNGKRFQSEAKYIKNSKENAYEKINEKKQKIIKQLTIDIE